MDLFEAVRRRRMTRRFDDRPIPRDVLERIVGAAVRAPSAGFSQGWAFLVLEGEPLRLFWEITSDVNWRADSKSEPSVLSAPVIVLPLAHKTAYIERYRQPDKAAARLANEDDWPVPYWLVDTGMASMLMLLAAEAEGVGALFFGVFRGMPELLAELDVPEGYEPIGAIALGYRAADDAPSGSPRSRPRRPTDEVVHWGRWASRTS